MRTDRSSQAKSGAARRREAKREPNARPRQQHGVARPPDPSADPEASAAWRSMRWNRSIFGRTPEIRGIPVPVIVVGAALLAAVLILYLVFSGQSPLVGGDTGDPGQPVQPQIQQGAPE